MVERSRNHNPTVVQTIFLRLQGDNAKACKIFCVFLNLHAENGKLCKMFPPFIEDKAKIFLIELLQKLQCGKIELLQVAKESEERKNQGVTLGILVCKNNDGEELVLAANSGNAKKLVFRKANENIGETDGTQFIFVDSIVTGEQIESALKKNDLEIHEITDKIKKLNKKCGAEYEDLNSKLKTMCAESLSKVHELYFFNCVDGKLRSLKEICTKNHPLHQFKNPPTGTGDCSAPKLLDYAFKNHLVPISMAECRFSAEDKTDPQKIELLPPCDERCGIILPAMLGIEILYRDEDIIVVNKQSGLLSVPGRGPDKQDCIVNRVKALFPDCIEQPSVHRLDMETSGILILAFTKEAHRNLCRQFEEGKVQKKYIALLDGVLAKKGIAQHGETELYFRLDVENRPHQIWDAQNGKKAVTEWQILNVERYKAPDGSTRNVTRVEFIPHTGRTHQLRLASADEHGFGVPIIGDTLYGHCDEGERLMLHAKFISFTHPATGKTMTFTCEPPF